MAILRPYGVARSNVIRFNATTDTRRKDYPEIGGSCRRAAVQPFLEVRTAVLNDALEDAFRHRYPGFRPANNDEAIAVPAL